MGRPREHDDHTRTALLQAAERLVERHGPAALSVRAVAEAVGTTTRAVYTVFGSKAGLLEALAQQLFELLTAAVESVPQTSDPTADVVQASLRAFRRVALEHPLLYQLVFLRVAPDLELGPAFNASAAAAFSKLEELVGRVLPSPTPTSRRNAARAVHALTEGLASMELRGALGSKAQAEQVWRFALTNLLQGLSLASRHAG